ncbi:unnamed protein product [Cuscuta epithymum]|uniref:Uncharacterized protein n=1 Tax=Cuscuta epithymum TaxID=186058 RepID=A0AAV0D7E3_9ASTE|nr:unnamed protein product [Cuscuta epithymum]
MCSVAEQKTTSLVNVDKDRYQKLVLIETQNKNLAHDVTKQKELLETLTSVTQTVPATIEKLSMANANEFQKIEILPSNLHDANRREEDTQSGSLLLARTSASGSADHVIYYERNKQKKIEDGTYKPPPPPPPKKSTKKSSFSFSDWKKSSLSRPDPDLFEQMRKKMTPLQQENIYLDHEEFIMFSSGGSIEEAEDWWKREIVPGKTAQEGIMNYLDCKLTPAWSSYATPRNLLTIRAKVNAKLKEFEAEAAAA